MTRKPRGLSFLELLVAMTITFLAISFLMGLFVSGARNHDRSKQFSTAGILAQGKMELLQAMPLDSIVQGTDSFTGQFAQFTYTVDVDDAGDYDGDGIADPDMKMLTLTVKAPDGKGISKLTALRPRPEGYMGVACHGNDSNLTFMGSEDPCDRHIRGWNFADPDPTTALDPSVLWPFSGGPAKDMPAGGRPGSVAATADLQTVWATDLTNNGVRMFKDGLSDWTALSQPPGLGSATDVALSGSGSMLWLTDESNRALWLLDTTSGVWSGPLRPGVPDTLGRVRGVTCCQGGTDVYVADIDNDCVRHYSGSSTGTWSSSPIKNPDNSLDQVNGVAVTRDNTKLYVMDAQTLQWTDPMNPVTWRKIDLEPKLIEDIPHGLAVSDNGKVVWAIAKNGLLFRCDLTDPVNPVWAELGP